ncbi:phage holin family protein [Robbsia sp. Bb-Pol-6]|uniref:Phage holin family protein n=1 Tax=Robbsia betulipollinis TaxID=2981849 RepID=A0ABT3ZRR1_9BURK|nr:phage holin family protein [Robbsia betulipollinis]MCY0389107.1 phage holin family protein [Robbsia betulipollinis]
MPTPLAFVALIAHLVAALHILAYRGGDAHPHASWLAWALLVVSGGSALELALTAKTVGILEALRAGLLSAFVLGARIDVQCSVSSTRIDGPNASAPE